MEQKQNDLTHYRNVLRRRKLHIFLPFALTLLLVVAVAFLLPSIYRSQATILIEAQEIPREFVQSTVTGYIEERLQTLTQVVLSRGNLLELMDRHDPYPELKGRYTTEDLLEKEVRVAPLPRASV